MSKVFTCLMAAINSSAKKVIRGIINTNLQVLDIVVLTVFGVETFAFQFVGFMLSLFLKSTSSRSQLVLFLSTFATGSKRLFADRCQVVNDLAQLIQFLANGRQLFGVGCQVVTVTSPGFTTVRNKIFEFSRQKSEVVKKSHYLCLMPCILTSPLNTGSTMSFNLCGSSIFVSKLIFCPLGPLA